MCERHLHTWSPSQLLQVLLVRTSSLSELHPSTEKLLGPSCRAGYATKTRKTFFSDSAPSARLCSEYLTNDIWLHLSKFLFLDGVPCSSVASVTLPFLVCSQPLGSGFSYSSWCILLCQCDSYSTSLPPQPCPAQSPRQKDHSSLPVIALVYSQCSVNVCQK